MQVVAGNDMVLGHVCLMPQSYSFKTLEEPLDDSQRRC